jgi:hypothetical protein
MYEAHAIVVLTEWDEFKTYDYERVYKSMPKPVRSTVAFYHVPAILSYLLILPPLCDSHGLSHSLSHTLSLTLSHTLTYKLTCSLTQAFIFDGRRCLDHTALEAIGFRVESIGRKFGFEGV